MDTWLERQAAIVPRTRRLQLQQQRMHIATLAVQYFCVFAGIQQQFFQGQTIAYVYRWHLDPYNYLSLQQLTENLNTTKYTNNSRLLEQPPKRPAIFSVMLLQIVQTSNDLHICKHFGLSDHYVCCR